MTPCFSGLPQDESNVCVKFLLLYIRDFSLGIWALLSPKVLDRANL